MTGCQAFQADHQRLDGGVATDGLDARHHSFRDVVATGDAAEDVDEDGLHLVLANQNVCVCVCACFSNISSARLLMIWRAWLDCTSFRPNFASHLSVGRLGLP